MAIFQWLWHLPSWKALRGWSLRTLTPAGKAVMIHHISPIATTGPRQMPSPWPCAHPWNIWIRTPSDSYLLTVALVWIRTPSDFLFINYSFAFNTIIPTKFIFKLFNLVSVVSIPLYSWLIDIMIIQTYSMIILTIIVLQDCILCRYYTPYTLTAKSCSNSIKQIADDTTIVCQNMNKGRDEVQKGDRVLLHGVKTTTSRSILACRRG